MTQVFTDGIADTAATWSEDAFNGPSGSHFLEVTSGSHTGLRFDIVQTFTASAELQLYPDPAVLSPGTTYLIRPHWTLASLFGPANEAGLTSGFLPVADEVVVRDAEFQQYLNYYFKDGGLGGSGWRSAASLYNDQTNAPLSYSEGLIARRHPGDAITLGVTGDLPEGPSLIRVYEGLNLIANPYPFAFDSLSDLIPGSAGPLQGAAPASTADWLYLPLNGELTALYFNTTSDSWLIAEGPQADTAPNFGSDPVLPANHPFLIKSRQTLPFILPLELP